MDIPTLPENITERIDHFINVLFLEDADWDALVTEMVSLVQAHEPLKALMFHMFEAFDCFDMQKFKKDVPLSCENLLAILAMKHASPAPLNVAAGQAMGSKNIRGRPAFLKILNQAHVFKEAVVSFRMLHECPKCHASVTESTQFCKSCGTAMSQGTSSAISSTTVCSKCHLMMDASDAFCQRCGKPSVINDDVHPNDAFPSHPQCTQCQKIIAEGAAFCGACGTGRLPGIAVGSPASAESMLAQLEQKKAIAVLKEDYSMAQALKEQIAQLKAAPGTTAPSPPAEALLAQLKQQKAMAVSNEDYITAQAVQAELARLKAVPGSPAQGANRVPMSIAMAAKHALSSSAVTSDPSGANAWPRRLQSAGADLGSDTKLPKKGTPAPYPRYAYDEYSKQVIDLDNPNYNPDQPDGYTPNPRLTQWKPSQRLHDMERKRLSSYQEILSYLLDAIQREEVCSWPAQGVGKETPWCDLKSLHKAMKCVESLIYYSFLKDKQIHPEVIKEHMGMGSSPIDSQTLSELVKMGAAKMKVQDSLESQSKRREDPRAHDRGGHKDDKQNQWRGEGKQRQWRDKKDKSKIECYLCHKMGHMSFECPKKGPKEPASAALRERMQQLEKAAEKASAKPGQEGGVH